MGFEISEAVKVKPENEFAGDVADLIEAQDAADEQLSGAMAVDADNAKKAKFKIQDAAREQNRSARVRAVVEGETATLHVQIRPRRHRTVEVKTEK